MVLIIWEGTHNRRIRRSTSIYICCGIVPLCSSHIQPQVVGEQRAVGSYQADSAKLCILCWLPFVFNQCCLFVLFLGGEGNLLIILDKFYRWVIKYVLNISSISVMCLDCIVWICNLTLGPFPFLVRIRIMPVSPLYS